MEKNWLIRTKNNHILGPVSKGKVKELLENGSIKADDELCSADGYWFFVKETDLVNKYVKGDFIQEFNPVSEADSVLAPSANCTPKDTNLDSNGVAIPDDGDLEYPDMDALATGIELPEELDPEELDPEELILDEHDFISDNSNIKNSNVVDLTSGNTKKKVDTVDIPLPNKRKTSSGNKTNANNSVRVSKSFLSEKVLYIIAIILFVMALSGFYYRKRIIKQFIEAINYIISPVYAQVDPVISLKKKQII